MKRRCSNIPCTIKGKSSVFFHHSQEKKHGCSNFVKTVNGAAFVGTVSKLPLLFVSKGCPCYFMRAFRSLRHPAKPGEEAQLFQRYADSGSDSSCRYHSQKVALEFEVIIPVISRGHQNPRSLYF